jgi:hypothetical protein
MYGMCVCVCARVCEGGREREIFMLQSEEECKYLINLAKPHMVKSSVVDNETGKSKDSRLFAYAFIWLIAF